MPSSIATEKKRTDRSSLLALLLLSLLCLAGSLFLFNGNGRQFISVSLHSELKANYGVDPLSTAVPEIQFDLIEDALRNQPTPGTNVTERLSTLEGSLKTPVATITLLPTLPGTVQVTATQSGAVQPTATLPPPTVTLPPPTPTSTSTPSPTPTLPRPTRTRVRITFTPIPPSDTPSPTAMLEPPTDTPGPPPPPPTDTPPPYPPPPTDPPPPTGYP